MRTRGSWRGARCRRRAPRCLSRKAALKRLRQSRPGDSTRSICDIAMPGYDGFALLHTIRERESGDGRFTPAIAVTAYAGEESRGLADAAGYQFFLSKPYEFADLVDAVAQSRGVRL